MDSARAGRLGGWACWPGGLCRRNCSGWLRLALGEGVGRSCRVVVQYGIRTWTRELEKDHEEIKLEEQHNRTGHLGGRKRKTNDRRRGASPTACKSTSTGPDGNADKPRAAGERRRYSRVPGESLGRRQTRTRNQRIGKGQAFQGDQEIKN